MERRRRTRAKGSFNRLVQSFELNFCEAFAFEQKSGNCEISGYSTKVLRKVLTCAFAGGMIFTLFVGFDLWAKRDAWEMARRYENMDKTTRNPKIEKITDMGEYWLMEGTGGCWAATKFSLRMDKNTGVLTDQSGRKLLDPITRP